MLITVLLGSNNIIKAEETEVDPVSLPEYYCSLVYSPISTAKDQQDKNACWAYASLSALESRLMPQELWDFSEEHMMYHAIYTPQEIEGGDAFMSTAYFTSWNGPVADSEYQAYIRGDGEYPEAVKHVQEVQFLHEEDLNRVKYAIMQYGAVESSLHIAAIAENFIDMKYYNDETAAYCYGGDEVSNHEILIVGWDDNFPASSFNTDAYSDGAFICMNSWGEDFGYDGMFYVSYDDANILDDVVLYTRVDEIDNYDNIYQYDQFGWLGMLGYYDEKAYFSNIYHTETDQIVEAVSFYTTGVNSQYEVYVCPSYTGIEDLSKNKEFCTSGVLENIGYYTIDLPEPIFVNGDDNFAVIVYIETPDCELPVATETPTEHCRETAITFTGKYSYISHDGIHWQNTQDTFLANICLKCFTDNIE